MLWFLSRSEKISSSSWMCAEYLIYFCKKKKVPIAFLWTAFNENANQFDSKGEIKMWNKSFETFVTDCWVVKQVKIEQ